MIGRCELLNYNYYIYLNNEKPLDCLNRNREAESIKEDSIDESSHNLRPSPAKGVEIAPPLTESVITTSLTSHLSPAASPQTDEGNDQGDDVAHHVETVRYQGHTEMEMKD